MRMVEGGRWQKGERRWNVEVFSVVVVESKGCIDQIARHGYDGFGKFDVAEGSVGFYHYCALCTLDDVSLSIAGGSGCYCLFSVYSTYDSTHWADIFYHIYTNADIYRHFAECEM